jgi:rhamnogalacturonan endolyase
LELLGQFRRFTFCPQAIMRFIFALALALSLLFAAVTSVLANQPGGGSIGPDVKITEQGPNVILDNGIIRVTIVKDTATVSSFRFNGQEMANTMYYSMDGNDVYMHLSACQYTVKVGTADMADISLKSFYNGKRHQIVDVDAHFVLRRGATGMYSYAIVSHPASYAATDFNEWRMVWKLSNDLLEKIYVDDLRHWQMPSSEDYTHALTTGIKEIVQLTTGVRAGQYDCKYDFSASYYDIGCWGHASDKNKIGGWIVLGGYDFFNDGPTKQDLNAASGINHIHFGMDHYNASTTTIAAGQQWSKIFGPFLLYCDHSDKGADAMWADAKAQVVAEKAAWPYAWLMNTPEYPPVAQRGSVTGTFVIKDALKPGLVSPKIWIGMDQPPKDGAKEGNWQFDSMGYEYWVQADLAGHFTIPNVRPGTYTLYAFATGEVGEFSKTAVSVRAGQATALGDVTWNVPHVGASIAWEIGVPDRSAAEFKHGDDYFHGFVWKGFENEWTNPLEYTVGKSKPATDWNYAQTAWYSGTSNSSWKWRIHFNLAAVSGSGNASLTLAFASANRAHIYVYANDETKRIAMVSPSVEGGNALLRESIHAKYDVEYVNIPVGDLKVGANTITLEFYSTPNVQAHVMYDYLALEMPP